MNVAKEEIIRVESTKESTWVNKGEDVEAVEEDSEVMKGRAEVVSKMPIILTAKELKMPRVSHAT